MNSNDPAARLRAEMVAQLQERYGFSDPRVTAVLRRVPRHVFVPGSELSEAYGDHAIVTRYRDGLATSAASQPVIVAIMLEQLCPPEGGSVLEIGAGTGYNAALLSGLVGSSGRVVTVDIDPVVAEEARNHLAGAGLTNVEVMCGDGALGWADGAPYDGIIVTAGASDLAPAWVEQLAPQGRLVVPLSIRGVQQSVALTRADGHLCSATVCECMFIPLEGAMPNADRRDPVPRHPGVYVHAAAETEVDAGLVADALDHPGRSADVGVTASVGEVFGSLRRWLAFHELAAASLSYLGPPEGAGASGVPVLAEFTGGGVVRRDSPCILGPAGFAALDSAVPAATADAGPGRMVELALRAHGQAERETARFAELIAAWDAAGRPGTDRLRIDAYPAGASLPGTDGVVQIAPHTTFVVSST